MALTLASTTELNNGTHMPWLGLGVYQMTGEQEADRAIKSALETGYRSVDTAAIYGNEVEVGRAINSSGVAREDIFLTTKLWNGIQRDGNPMQAFEESLERLGTDYVDLYLIHWPVPDRYVDSWLAMEEIYKTGKAKAIGVSNFLIHHLEDVIEAGSVLPAVNQIEFQPYLVQPELQKFCKDKGIRPEAWSPLMQGAVVKDETITAIASKYGKTAAQVVLRWDLQHEVVTIPKSVTPSRIAENADLYDFELSSEDMAVLDGLDKGHRFGPDPDNFNF